MPTSPASDSDLEDALVWNAQQNGGAEDMMSLMGVFIWNDGTLLQWQEISKFQRLNMNEHYLFEVPNSRDHPQVVENGEPTTWTRTQKAAILWSNVESTSPHQFGNIEATKPHRFVHGICNDDDGDNDDDNHHVMCLPWNSLVVFWPNEIGPSSCRPNFKRDHRIRSCRFSEKLGGKSCRSLTYSFCGWVDTKKW